MRSAIDFAYRAIMTDGDAFGINSRLCAMLDSETDDAEKMYIQQDRESAMKWA